MLLLQQVDYLIEQTQQIQTHQQKKPPGTPTLIAQSIAASMIPALAVNSLISSPIKNALINSGVSTNNISGVANMSAADVGTSAITGIAGMAAGALGNTLLKKYQERKYGIYKPPDTRTLGQKSTDAALDATGRTLSLAGSTAAKAGIGAALGAGAAGSLLAVPAVMVASSIASKPINIIKQKILQKRAEEQQKKIQQQEENN
jgi:hypothetical protein